jgi:hypothetical protein
VAQVLDANNNIVGFDATAATPSRRTTFSPRIDYQINKNHTLVGRYSYTKTTRVTGVGGFSLPSRAYDTEGTEQNIQLTETAILSKTIVNETRFQFEHQTAAQNADNTIPTIEVQDAFTGGGSQVGQSHTDTNNWELTNNTSIALRNHALKAGARVRWVGITQFSPQNFGGTFRFFGGGIGPFTDLTSIERYQRTVIGVDQG